MRVTVVISLIALCPGAGAQPPEHIPRSADVSVAGVFLEDPRSLRKVLGDAPSPTEDVTGPDAGFRTLKVCNSTKTEQLVLVLHPGSVVDSYGEFRVRSDPKPPARCLVLHSASHFVSGKGIGLGISKKTLLGILGPGYSEHTEGSDTIVRYTINDFEHSSFLRHYNMPVYFGSYHFQDGKLVSFAFGFEYP